jgi:predicted MPP superfamily phosphohydrolase
MQMKRLLVLFLAFLLLLVGCTDGTPPSGSSTTTMPPPPEEPAPTGEVYRVLFSSDVHCTDLQTYQDVGNDVRMQHWVDSILAEHAREPIDLLVINGDTSLDHVSFGGAELSGRPITTRTFVDNYLSQLPKEIAVFVMPGNHEQHSHQKWLSITGNKRQGYRVLGDNLFIFLDTYNADLDPTTHHNGEYSGVDVSYIKTLMDTYPTHNIYLISHYFDMDKEPALRDLLF